MAMVINTNVQAIRTHGVYNHNSSAMNEAMTRVATGQKINSAKDNASTWAITQRMRDRMRANDQANQNVQNDSALIRTAQGGIENTVSILTTLKERAINAANDSNINLDRTAIATEVKQLVQQIDDNANKVKFNGRYLLNGAVDETATETPTTTTATAETSKVIEPTAAGMRAYEKDGSTTGSHAVYQNVGLKVWKPQSGTVPAGPGAAANTDLLVNLVKSDATTSDDKLFKVGDKITFSWKEDGQENSYTFEVKADTTISALAFNTGAIKFYNEATANTALTSKDPSTEKYTVESFDGATATAYTNEYNKNDVYDNTIDNISARTAADKVKSDSTVTSGLYAVGDYGVKITDFKVAVTYTDQENETATRVDAQEAMKLSGVQQVEEYDPIPKGSATVLQVTGISDGSSGSAAAATTNSRLMDLGLISGTATDGSDLVTLKWGDGEADSITVRADVTIGDLQQKLVDEGKSLRLGAVIADVASAASAGTELTDANGSKVTKVDTGNADGTNYQAKAHVNTSAQTASSLYFVSKTGETLSTDALKLTATDSTGTVNRNVTQLSVATALKPEAAAEETPEEAEELTIAESNPLTFHIGGEADFAIDVTIDKMTVDNLFAQRDADGTITKIYDDSSFSDLFKTKEGAKEAISIIDTALNTALAEQTKLGAVEARLGYTSDNLTTMNENLEAANSAFRDSDIAKEMTNYMKYSVLSQAAQYMLAQSGQNSFSVLNLLQQ